jgi:hypothetical protein
MSNIKLTGIATVTNEQVTFSVGDIRTLYVVPSNGVGTFINPDTVEVLSTETSITENELRSIGFFYSEKDSYKYRGLPLSFLQLTNGLTGGWWLILREQSILSVNNIGQLKTILDALFWHDKGK